MDGACTQTAIPVSLTCGHFYSSRPATFSHYIKTPLQNTEFWIQKKYCIFQWYC